MLENNESAIAIGKRLKHLRLLTGLNRYKIAEKANINKSTISLWENAKSSEGKPTRRSIGKLLDAFREAGVLCSENWLLTGTGLPPEMVKETSTKPNDFPNDEQLVVSANQQTLQDELNLFLKNKHSVVYQITTNYMFPIFQVGDLLGGIWQSSTIITEEKICIIKINDSLQVRRVRKGRREGRFSISYLIYDKEQIEPFEIDNITLQEVAPIIRLWRKEEN